MPEVQVSDGMLRKYFCAKYFCRIVIDNHSRNPQANICAKGYQLNWVEAREVKCNSYKLSKAHGKSAKDYYLPSY